jgi:hypothetical protein
MSVMWPALVLWLLAVAFPQEPKALTLELRVFDGAQDVTTDTQLTIFRAGERNTPVARVAPQQALVELQVAPGLYDVQALQERDGRVANIRWVERIVVVAYPDEAGHHLEVVNFKSTFGALQVRPRPGALPPEVALYGAGSHGKPVAARIGGAIYSLFVVPAGTYDLQVRTGEGTAWFPDIEVPLDRTRLWVVPQGSPDAQ